MFLGSRLHFSRKATELGSTVVPLNRSMISLYRSSVVPTSLTMTVMTQIAMQDLIGHTPPPPVLRQGLRAMLAIERCASSH